MSKKVGLEYLADKYCKLLLFTAKPVVKSQIRMFWNGLTWHGLFLILTPRVQDNLRNPALKTLFTRNGLEKELTESYAAYKVVKELLPGWKSLNF